MELLFVIVQRQAAELLCQRLASLGLRMAWMNSTGDFPPAANATVLVSAEKDEVESALAVIRATCQDRRPIVNSSSLLVQLPGMPLPPVIMSLEAEAGGAVVFGLPVRSMLRLQGGSAPSKADQKYVRPQEEQMNETTPPPQDQAGVIQLIVAIIHSDDASGVSEALAAAGHRFTRLTTVGGFLRRGNATLLIGAPPEQVNRVLDIMQAQCRLRMEPNAADAGMPMYGATVFILEPTRFVRI